jgi:integrase
MEQILLTELMNRAEQAMIDTGFKPYGISPYRAAFGKLKRVMKARGEDYFSEAAALEFIEESCRQKKLGFITHETYRNRKRLVRILIQLSNGKQLKCCFERTESRKYIVTPEQELLVKEFCEYMCKRGMQPNTVSGCSGIARRFLYWMNIDGITSVSALTLRYVGDCTDKIGQGYSPTTLRTVYTQLRIFTKFLWETGKTAENLTLAVPARGVKSYKVIPSISVEEEKLLLGCLDRTNIIGKRDYAIFVLGIRTGLRSSDILNLKLTDIDWHANTINIVQQKNGKPLILPLLPEVGNAVADYILHGRPNSKEPYVFLRIRPPFLKLSDCCTISYRYFKKLGIRQGNGDSRGFHVFRHTAATRMLAEEVPVTVISNVLGHSSVESGKTYLGTDETHMKMCALNFNGILPREGV